MTACFFDGGLTPSRPLRRSADVGDRRRTVSSTSAWPSGLAAMSAPAAWPRQRRGCRSQRRASACTWHPARRRRPIHGPGRCAVGGGKALRRQEVAPAACAAHRPDDIRRYRRGNQAELHFATGRSARRRPPSRCRSGEPGPCRRPIAVALHPATTGFAAAWIARSIRRPGRRVGEVLVAAVAGHVLHPVQVGAGAEGRAAGRQHHRAQPCIPVQRFEHRRDLGDGGLVERVAHVGTVQPDTVASAPSRTSSSVWYRTFHSSRYIRNTPNFVGFDRRVQRGRQPQPQHHAGVGRVDHAVVPQPGAGEVRDGPGARTAP